jgi:Uma2 family endonuclease
MPEHAMSTPRFTYGEYCLWAGDERWELVAGEAYNMSPAPSRRHQDVVGGLFTQIALWVRHSPCRVYVAPFDVRLPHGDETDAQIDTVVQPDISVICDARKLDDQGCRGAPNWIVEVISPHTAARDHILKRALYERHGVHEYWIVHPIDRLLILYLLRDHGYAPPIICEARGFQSVTVLAGLTIDWDVIFDT